MTKSDPFLVPLRDIFLEGRDLATLRYTLFIQATLIKKAWREAGHFIVRKGFGTTAQTTCEHVVCNIYAVEGQ